MNSITKRLYEAVHNGDALGERSKAHLLGIIAVSDELQEQVEYLERALNNAAGENSRAFDALIQSVAINDQCRKLIGELRGEIVRLKTEHENRGPASQT